MTGAPATSVPTLEMRNVSKTFPGVKALNGVSLTARGGEVLALMGENGGRQVHPDEGAFGRISGRSGCRNPHRRAAHRDRRSARGEAQWHCDNLSGTRLAPNLTVAENIYVGDELHSHGLLDRKA